MHTHICTICVHRSRQGISNHYFLARLVHQSTLFLQCSKSVEPHHMTADYEHTLCIAVTPLSVDDTSLYGLVLDYLTEDWERHVGICLCIHRFVVGYIFSKCIACNCFLFYFMCLVFVFLRSVCYLYDTQEKGIIFQATNWKLQVSCYYLLFHSAAFWKGTVCKL